MNSEQIFYLVPYLVSFAFSVSILAFLWGKRHAQGATAFIWYALGQSLLILGFICELISADLSTKIFWDSAQWLAWGMVMIILPIFAVQFAEHNLKKPRLWLGLSFIVPFIFAMLLFTDPTFHWIYWQPRLIERHPFAELFYDFQPAVYGYAVYGYAIALWSIYVLSQRIIHPHGLYRAQVILMIVGLSIPILGTIFTLLNIYITPQRDSIPFSTVISNLIIVWALFRFRVFEVTPIGRDNVFEALVEPVVILDNKSNIVDINSAMLALLDKKALDVIGKPAKLVFENFPIPIKQYTQSSYARTEASFEFGGMNIHYELTVWPIYNARKEMTGRIYISHDITAMKQLENELRKLNTQLEDRVASRTHELAEAYDTTLEGWARALELRDKETEGHTRRVTDTTLKIALKLDFPDDMIEHIRRGAILHDIGKMGIPDDILHKPDKLTKEERDIVMKHPETAYKLLKPISFLERAIDIPYCHHEKWDGSGYPRGLKGGEIPVAARIFAIADVWDALSVERSYNKPWSQEKMIAYFIEQSGKHFDPHMVNIFLDMVEKGEI